MDYIGFGLTTDFLVRQLTCMYEYSVSVRLNLKFGQSVDYVSSELNKIFPPLLYIVFVRKNSQKSTSAEKKFINTVCIACPICLYNALHMFGLFFA